MTGLSNEIPFKGAFDKSSSSHRCLFQCCSICSVFVFFFLLFHSCYLFLFHSINTHLAMPRNSNLNSNTTTSMFFFVLFFVFFLEKDPANRVRECLSMLSVTL